MNSFLKKYFKIEALILLLFILCAQNNYSQDINKEVTVVKPYQPIVMDATKINLIPSINDTVSVTPVFQYSISSKRLDNPFQPRPVKAAKMVDEPIEQLYNSYLKLGIGNPWSPLAELSIANTRSKDNSLCLYLHHYSANGQVKLDNNNKVDAPFSEDEATLYGKHLFKQLEVIGSLGYSNYSYYFYGYDTALHNISLDKNDISQHYQLINSSVALNSLGKDSSRLIYKSVINYSYFSDNYKNAYNIFGIKGKFGKTFNKYYLGAGLSYNYYNANNVDSIHDGIISICPNISKRTSQWSFVAGIDAIADNYNNNSKFYTYPHLNFEFIVAQDVLSIFTGWEGHLVQNNLYNTSKINPYIIPGLQVQNTNFKSELFGGMKGNFSSNIHFIASATYANVDNQYFFINDTTIKYKGNKLGNQFNVVYDKADVFLINAEIEAKVSNEISLTGKINYSGYSLYHEAHPWNIPALTGNLTAKYNMQDKIIISTDINFEGSRYYLSPQNENVLKLNPLVDINLGLEYKYNKILSFFIQFKNLSATRYNIWSQYPVYRFRVMGGFTYSL